jgi:hypothetical protein
MLGAFARFLFALAALSPVAITWVIATSRDHGFGREQVVVLSGAALMALVCYLVLREARQRLGAVSFEIQEVKAMDNEVVAYVVAYLFPMIAPSGSIDYLSFGFVLLVLAAVLSSAHAFTFNPVLTLFGYHFYEVKCKSEVSYLLLSRSDITDVKQVDSVGRLTNYLMIDLTRRG